MAYEPDRTSLSNVLDDIKQLIEHGRLTAYASVNSTMISTNWAIGKRIVEEGSVKYCL